eukprot:154171_1
MPSFCSYTFKERTTRLLVFGYIRSHEKYISMPQDLYELFFQFYNEKTYLTLNGDKLNEFISCKHKNPYLGPIIEIMNCKFQMIFYPNGEFDDEEGYVQFYLELIDKPQNMKCVIIYYIMNCIEANYECRSCHKFIDLKNATAWPPFNVPIKVYKQSNELHFGCFIDVKHIVYNKKDKKDEKDENDKKIQSDYTNPMKINICSEYKWDISNELLTMFKNAPCGKGFYSPNYGNNTWCLIIGPNGDNKTNKGSFICGPKILQLPFGIGAIGVIYSLESNYNNIKWNDMQLFHYSKKCAQWSDDTFPNDALKDIDHLWVKVTNKIISVYGTDLQLIESDLWSKYGIK